MLLQTEQNNSGPITNNNKSFDTPRELARFGSTIMTPPPQEAKRSGVKSDTSCKNIQDAVYSLHVEREPCTQCVVEGCDQLAVTAKKVAGKCNPGSWPPSHCSRHGEGPEFLRHMAACLGGKEKGPSCIVCEECASNKDCRTLGCKKGGNGNTIPRTGLCNECTLLRLRKSREKNRDVKDCRRCGQTLDGNRGTGHV